MAHERYRVWPEGDLIDGQTARVIHATEHRMAAVIYFSMFPFPLSRPLCVALFGEDPEEARRFTFTVREVM